MLGLPHARGGVSLDAWEERHSGGLPHARGGVSKAASNDYIGLLSSPRPWGCFWTTARRAIFRKVFPTPVGVFLTSPSISMVIAGLPHARGGVS